MWEDLVLYESKYGIRRYLSLNTKIFNIDTKINISSVDGIKINKKKLKKCWYFLIRSSLEHIVSSVIWVRVSCHILQNRLQRAFLEWYKWSFFNLLFYLIQLRAWQVSALGLEQLIRNICSWHSEIYSLGTAIDIRQ